MSLRQFSFGGFSGQKAADLTRFKGDDGIETICKACGYPRGKHYPSDKQILWRCPTPAEAMLYRYGKPQLNKTIVVIP